MIFFYEGSPAYLMAFMLTYMHGGWQENWPLIFIINFRILQCWLHTLYNLWK